MYMKRLLIVTLCTLAAALTACCPCRHLTESSRRRDSVRIETVVRTERIKDTVFIDIPAERERQTVRDTASHLETSYALSDARINADGSLFHSLTNKAQRRPVQTEKEIVCRDSIVYRDRDVEVEEIVEVERKLTWWQKMQMRGFWAMLLVLLFLFRKQIILFVRRILAVMK